MACSWRSIVSYGVLRHVPPAACESTPIWQFLSPVGSGRLSERRTLSRSGYSLVTIVYQVSSVVEISVLTHTHAVPHLATPLFTVTVGAFLKTKILQLDGMATVSRRRSSFQVALTAGLLLLAYAACDRYSRYLTLSGPMLCRWRSSSTATGASCTSSNVRRRSAVWIRTSRWRPSHVVETLDRFSSRRLDLEQEWSSSCLVHSWTFWRRWSPSSSASSYAGRQRHWPTLARW